MLAQEFAAQSKKRHGLDAEWKKKIDEAVRALRLEELDKIHGQGGITEQMLGAKENQEALAAKPELGGAILSAVNLAWLDKVNLDTAFGQSKNDVLSEALLAIGKKNVPLKTGAELDRKAQFDPALFSKLAVQVDPDVWNDKGPRKRGLGPRVCQTLWRNGNYDQICELIQHGVDTSVAARVTGTEGRGVGVYSGFVQPIQHVVSNYLRDVALVDSGDTSLPQYRKVPAQGAKKILKALEDKGTAVTLTKWSEVKNSEIIDEFKKHPGTIWGFEDVRMPYVQAAHETSAGVQPVRMMELWEAVFESLSEDAYTKLLDDPASAIDEFIKVGVQKIEKGLVSEDPLKQAKYGDIARDSKTYIANFKRDAKAFLTEFAAQMPKGTFARPGSGGAEAPNEAGITPGKFMGGLACKAGLWWAKNENKPVYYCLDGINMDDVTNYKKAKNTAIEDFITAGGQPSGAKGHDEVITIVELREIVKNWNELKDTVNFVRKGKILEGDDLARGVKAWQTKNDEGEQGSWPHAGAAENHVCERSEGSRPGADGQASQRAGGRHGRPRHRAQIRLPAQGCQGETPDRAEVHHEQV